MPQAEPATLWKLSPLMKWSLFCGVPYVFAVAVLFVGGMFIGIVKWVNKGHVGGGTIGLAVVEGVLLAGCLFLAYWNSWKASQILAHGKFTNARIEGIEARAVNPTTSNSAKLYTLHVSITDEEGQAWQAAVPTGIYGGDEEEGAWLEAVYDPQAPERVLLLKFIPGNPLFENGEIRPRSPGSTYGFIIVGAVCLVGWIVTLAW